MHYFYLYFESLNLYITLLTKAEHLVRCKRNFSQEDPTPNLINIVSIFQL